ncbi:DUF58 domain-containing protein [Gephyromycinifex aptenodytis]|uniref:DUF58 domain-containing protein n=1 Tax=Gephyromycinifex aptenodytis TaxID=2716227 RepID=UPI0014477923|nr:DUF58 domain-containing protein [Gephyromycinifex aptenodytis]
MSTTTRTRPHLSGRGRGLVAAGLTLTGAGLVLGFADLARVGLLALLLPLLSTALVVLFRPQVDVELIQHQAALETGVSGAVSVQVRCRTRACPDLQLQVPASAGLDVTAPGRSPHSGPLSLWLPKLGRGQLTRVGMEIRAQRRGRHRIGPLRLVLGDPFALVTVSLLSASDYEVIARAPIHPLEHDRPGAVSIEGDGNPIFAVGSPGLPDIAIRSYRIGDDLRRVHWPVTAHRGQLMVRQDSHPRSNHSALLVGPCLQAGADGRCHSLDWAVEAMGSVAVHLDAVGHELTLVADAGRDSSVVTSHHPLAQILDELAVLEPQPSKSSQAEASSATRGRRTSSGIPDRFAAQARTAIGGSTCVVLACSSNDQAAAGSLLALLPPGRTGLVFVLDQEAFTGSGPSAAAEEITQLARCAGWSSVHITPEMSVAQAWWRLQAREPARRP